MAEQMHGYFRSENDAESALAKLQRLKVENIFIDSLPEDKDRAVFVPAVGSQSGYGVLNSGIPGFLEGITNNEETFTHVLEFEVAEENAEEAFRLLQEEDAYVDESLSSKYNS